MQYYNDHLWDLIKLSKLVLTFRVIENKLSFEISHSDPVVLYFNGLNTQICLLHILFLCPSRSCKQYVLTDWETVHVGDIVHLSCNEVIPADILLLHSSDDHGLCYIETSNLDGENNLKQRDTVVGLSENEQVLLIIFSNEKKIIR